MVIYVCQHCRNELYKENEEEKECESHSAAPVDKIYIEDKVEE